MSQMLFEWDEDKRKSNSLKHKLDFIDVQAIFDGRPAITIRSKHADEERYLTTAQHNGIYITVVWTKRENVVRIISARRAWAKHIFLLQRARGHKHL